MLLRFSLCSCFLLIPYWPIDISSYQKALLLLLFNAQEKNKQQISSLLGFSTLRKSHCFFVWFYFLFFKELLLSAFQLSTSMPCGVFWFLSWFLFVFNLCIATLVGKRRIWLSLIDFWCRNNNDIASFLHPGFLCHCTYLNQLKWPLSSALNHPIPFSVWILINLACIWIMKYMHSLKCNKSCIYFYYGLITVKWEIHSRLYLFTVINGSAHILHKLLILPGKY